MIIERVKFYADTTFEKNKFFCWKTSILTLEETLFRFFAKGWAIRAAWYESTNDETGETINMRIPVQELFDKFVDLSAKQKKFQIKAQIKSST